MQATTAPNAPPAPAAPLTPAAAGAPTAAAPAIAGIPQSVGELRALRAERKEISSQLENVAARRARLSTSLKGKEGIDRAGVEARISILDKRMLQLESQLDQTGQQLAMAPGTLTSAADLPRFTNMDPDAVAALGALFMIVVLAPIAFAAARMMWKRTNRAVAAPLPDEASRRLERLEPRHLRVPQHQRLALVDEE